jgi:hypothetical protein
MHHIKIKLNQHKGPVRMEVTLQNTSHGQVQRFKYFPSTDGTSAVDSREEIKETSTDTGQASALFVDQCDDSVPLHKRTKGKVRGNSFYLASNSKEVDTE